MVYIFCVFVNVEVFKCLDEEGLYDLINKC